MPPGQTIWRESCLRPESLIPSIGPFNSLWPQCSGLLLAGLVLDECPQARCTARDPAVRFCGGCGARFVRGWGNLVTGLATGEKPLVRQVMGEAQTLRASVRVPMRDLEERAVPREICGLQVPERPLRASRKRLPAGCAQVAGACFAGLPGNPTKQPLFPNLCPSCARADPPLPCACACVYSSPSRRTPMCGRANPENRILRKTQEVRQTI